MTNLALRLSAAGSRFFARNGGQRSEQIALGSHDADLAVGNLDSLGQGTQMVAAIAAAFDPDPLAGRGCELANSRRACKRPAEQRISNFREG